MGRSKAAEAEASSVARQVAAIVKRVTGDPAYHVFLFGSWATGRARERSDIDIGVGGPAPLDPVLMQEIREACEDLATLHTIDLVDFALLPPHVREHAMAGAVPVEVA